MVHSCQGARALPLPSPSLPSSRSPCALLTPPTSNPLALTTPTPPRALVSWPRPLIPDPSVMIPYKLVKLLVVLIPPEITDFNSPVDSYVYGFIKKHYVVI